MPFGSQSGRPGPTSSVSISNRSSSRPSFLWSLRERQLVAAHVLVELLLRRVRPRVHARHLDVVRVAAPVGAGQAAQLERAARDLAGVRDVRAAAQVDEVARAVEAQRVEVLGLAPAPWRTRPCTARPCPRAARAHRGRAAAPPRTSRCASGSGASASRSRGSPCRTAARRARSRSRSRRRSAARSRASCPGAGPAPPSRARAPASGAACRGRRPRRRAGRRARSRRTGTCPEQYGESTASLVLRASGPALYSPH